MAERQEVINKARDDFHRPGLPLLKCVTGRRIGYLRVWVRFPLYFVHFSHHFLVPLLYFNGYNHNLW